MKSRLIGQRAGASWASDRLVLAMNRHYDRSAPPGTQIPSPTGTVAGGGLCDAQMLSGIVDQHGKPALER